MTPIQLFCEWYKQEQKMSTVRIPSACCLSTIGEDGFPNARFVSLKEIHNDSFIVTGSLTSRKGIEISQTNKVALTFWWAFTERQVRIQGSASTIPEILADRLFAERSRDSQLVSIVSDQGQHIENIEPLINQYEIIDKAFQNKSLIRPKNWGGFSIKPIRIEFLEFKPTRFHDRKLYEFINGEWQMMLLQP